MSILEFLTSVEEKLHFSLRSSSLTQALVQSTTSKYITYIFIILFILVLLYETFYWSGIYLGLWEYHAKDIFTEVPVHCAHVYIRLNTITSAQSKEIMDYFKSHENSISHQYIWNKFTLPLGLTSFPITYNFEFSPEDFEMNDEPEFGSTVEHLRSKILQVYKDSPRARNNPTTKSLSESDVIIFNHKYQLLDSEYDDKYLSNCHIETGDLINCFIQI